MNKKLFSVYITIIPLLIFGIEIFVRVLGFGPAFDLLGSNIRGSGEKAAIILSEIESKDESELVGSWEASDIKTSESTIGDINLTIYNANSFSEKIVDKKKDSNDDKRLRVSKSGNFYAHDSRIIFVPFSYKTEKNSITITDLKNHPDKYSESYNYQIKDNQLILTDIKTNETISFIKNEK